MSKTKLGFLLVVVLMVTALLGVLFGSVPILISEIWDALTGDGQEVHRDIVLNFRLPRVLLAAFVGGGLGVAGATFQALLRNPLAEPYILGISGGASFGAVSVLSLGVAAAGSWTLPLAAFAGALLAIFLVFRVATSTGRVMDVRILLLSGVVIAAFFSACIAFILSISPAQTVQSAVLWSMGSLAGADWDRVVIAGAYTMPAAVMLIVLARPLNLMAIGEETAYYLGTNVEGVKRISLVVAALITAASVSVAGVIGFVGLVVPHTVRILVGSDHRGLLPLSFLGGAAFLIAADFIARLVLSPIEIPIGVITAFIGVPFFLVLLRQSSPNG
ncbi:MAG TPA: iron ABC transporter permease [Gemmatimonadetes bacterium]|jgi:iron complex transport system permease protein|nr:iron ABC transporter permease [Gemmatimonadota bacterium]HIB09626.1 iron ABC transporter permease [Gemmatimonadota bacterium]HIC15051.1 iron ABC transporter permease [Gemmatimonadota bacterium]HIN77282.1 iron ABC transporter permease [Gemmatimonadota bacterium]